MYRRRTTKSYPLSVEGKITVSHVSLPEPDKLTFYTAFLAGYRRRCFDLKMKVMLLHLVAKDEVLRQMENVVWKTGHTIPLLVQLARGRQCIEATWPQPLAVCMIPVSMKPPKQA